MRELGSLANHVRQRFDLLLVSLEGRGPRVRESVSDKLSGKAHEWPFKP